MSIVTKQNDSKLKTTNVVAEMEAAINAALHHNSNRMVDLFKRWCRMVVARRAQRADYLELSKMSDRDLDDIGLLRTNISNMITTRCDRRRPF